jgi:hypothetical protein
VIRKPVVATALIISLSLTLAFAVTFVNSAKANPVLDEKYVDPPYGTNPPTILISSPNNNTVIASGDVSLAFNVSITESENTRFLTEVYYEVDWQEGKSPVYHLDMTTPNQNWITEFSHNKPLTGIPEGKHNITVIAAAWGSYTIGLTMYSFDIGGSSSVSFTVDTTPPSVSVSSLENDTQYAPDIALNFTVNEAVTQITYSLDGQENVTINGNTTLPQLSYGAHNVIVYATDVAGNTGASETISFTVAKPEPFPTAQVAAASTSIIVVIGVGLLVYFKKRKQLKLQSTKRLCYLQNI